MITRAEQLELLAEDIRRAVAAGLVTMIKYPNDTHCGEFLIADAVTRDVLIELLEYLRQAYPDIRSTPIGRNIYYDL